MACDLIGLSDGTRQVPPGQRRQASTEPIFRANYKAWSGLTFERVGGSRFTDFRHDVVRGGWLKTAGCSA